MAWSTPYTATAGTILTAATWNVYVRDDLSYLKGLLDGTGGAVPVTVPSSLAIANDANFLLSKAGANPAITFDAGSDTLLYDRTANSYQFYIAAALKLLLDANGKLTGAGFYDSGEFSLAASGGSTTLSHGLAAKPRFYAGRWGNSTGDANLTKPVLLRETFEVYIQQFSDTTITVVNLETATRFIRIFAML